MAILGVCVESIVVIEEAQKQKFAKQHLSGGTRIVLLSSRKENHEEGALNEKQIAHASVSFYANCRCIDVDGVFESLPRHL